MGNDDSSFYRVVTESQRSLALGVDMLFARILGEFANILTLAQPLRL